MTADAPMLRHQGGYGMGMQAKSPPLMERGYGGSESQKFRDVSLTCLLIDSSLLRIFDSRDLNFPFAIFNPLLLLRITLCSGNPQETSLEVVFDPFQFEELARSSWNNFV